MNPEISKYQFVKKDVIAEILGEQIVVDPIEVLTRPKGPFKLTSSRSTLFGMYLGKGLPNEGGYFVRLGNNTGETGFDETIINGVFRVDPRHRRVLFSPGESISLRDSYRAIGSDYTYNGSLTSLIKLLTLNDFTIHQATLIRNLPNSQLEPVEFVRLQDEAAELFHKLTGMSAFEAYQAEGALTLEQILSKNFLTPIPMEADGGTFIRKIMEEW